MEHLVEIVVELEEDGAALPGFPWRFAFLADFFEPFVSQDFGDTGFTAPSPQPGSQLSALFLTSDQNFSAKLNGEATAQVDVLCGGFILVVGTAMALAPFLTTHATGILPAYLWGFVAGKNT